MRYDRTVIGYHGCTAGVAQELLRGQPFRRSENDYDWLGHGVYFWEYGAHRAYRFAEEKIRRESRRARPAVIGALIQLGRCFDLLDTRFTHDLAQAYEGFARVFGAAGATIPRNEGPEGKLRRLDCALLNWYLGAVDGAGRGYQTVRAAFPEGDPVYPESAFFSETHIQLTVRDPSCIIGVFKPTFEADVR